MKRLMLQMVLLAMLLVGHGLLVPAARAATTCTATSTILSFGSVSTTGMTDAMATFNVTCSSFGLALLANAKVRMCLSIGDGANGSGHFLPRQMLNGTNDPLQFQLYTDAARGQIWGSQGNASLPTPLGVDFDYSVPLLGGTQTRTITLYGRVPVQILTSGTFSNPFTGTHTRMDYRYNETILGTAAYPPSCTSGGKAGTSVSGAFPFTVTATVPTECRAFATTNLGFGSIAGAIVANKDMASTISMTCTGRTSWNIGLNNGQHASGTTRRMQLGTSAHFVNYELFRDPARTSRWGNTINTDTLTGAGTGSMQPLTVYGRVPATQIPNAGNYSDVITVTISY